MPLQGQYIIWSILYYMSCKKIERIKNQFYSLLFFSFYNIVKRIVSSKRIQMNSRVNEYRKLDKGVPQSIGVLSHTGTYIVLTKYKILEILDFRSRGVYSLARNFGQIRFFK